MVKELLMNKGADVNATDFLGNTPLIMAVENGHVETVKYLLDNGADVNAKNIDGLTATKKASLGGHIDILRLLSDKSRAQNRRMILRKE